MPHDPGDPSSPAAYPSSHPYPDRPPAEPVLKLRITHITSTLSAPLASLRDYYVPSRFSTAIPPGNLPDKLPVMRIFGTTPNLQKICANIHMCYPYFYVPFPMDSSSGDDPLRPERVIKICQRFAVSLNHAICIASRQNPTSMGNTSKFGGGVDPKHLHIVSVMLVKGVPFYGYHIGYSYFLKVSLANPGKLWTALEQLRKPIVLGRIWQPHEAHMNHVLQFMCDFDLYGCGWLEVGGGKFRDPLPEGDPYDSPPSSPHGPPDVFNTLTVPGSMLYPIGISPPKDTYTPLEIDILPHHILNRLRLKPRNLHQDFIELLHQPLDPNEKLVPAVAELWEDERRRRSLKGLSLGSDAMMPGSGGMGGRTMAELGYKVSGKDEENKGGNWKISEELWQFIQDRMEEERRKKGKLTFKGFSNEIALGKNGEKRQYDKATVSAHWPRPPRPPRSTQRSRRSAKSNNASSQPNPLSSPGAASIALTSSPRGHEASSPTQAEIPLINLKGETPEDDEDGAAGNFVNGHSSESDSEGEEDNPFEQYAMTQASQHVPIDMDVNTRMISRHPSEAEDENRETDDYPDDEGDNAKRHAEEGAKFRATQMPRKEDKAEIKEEAENEDEDGEEALFDDIDDEDITELIRQNFPGGTGSGQSTPRRTRFGSVPFTPSTRSSATGLSSGDMSERRAERQRRMMEQAGLGDLDTIMDRSSVSLPSPRNPWDNRPITPTKPSTPISEKPTPTTLMRNLFAKNRQSSISPLNTPSKNRAALAYDSPNVIMLPPLRRTEGDVSSSPPSASGSLPPDPEDTLAELSQMQNRVTSKLGISQDDLEDAKEELKEIEAELPDQDVVDAFFRPKQKTPVSVSNSNSLSQSNSRSTRSTKTSASDENGQFMTPTYKGTKRPLSPTLKNQEGGAEEDTPKVTLVPSSALRNPDALDDPNSRVLKSRKRVRLATPPGASRQSLIPTKVTVMPVSTPMPTQTPKSTSSTNGTTTQSSQRSQPTTNSDSTSNPHIFSSTSWQFREPPPGRLEIMTSMEEHGVPSVIYQAPYYSNPIDVPPRSKQFAGRVFSLKGNSVKDLQDFGGSFPDPLGDKRWLKSRKSGHRWKWGWEYGITPPMVKDVKEWCEKEDTAQRIQSEAALTSKAKDLEKPTQKSKFGFKFSQKQKSKESKREQQNMSVLALEVFAQSRNQLLPDPEKDAVTAVFYCYQNDDPTLEDNTKHKGYHTGYIILKDPKKTKATSIEDETKRLKIQEDIKCTVLENELDLINFVVDLTKHWDPDVLAGWELHNSSWGYLVSRAHEEFSIDLMDQLSRVVSGHTGPKKDGYSAHHTSTFKVSGRHILNIWRICRSEINLNNYSFENVVFHLLHQRIPRYSPANLTALWRSKTPEHAHRVLRYYFQRVVIYMEIVDAAEIITKNAEFARVFGVDFASVMFRGSQYKVESFMFRIAKPESFVLVSPSKEQVGLQNAPFAVPLIAEPESKYYTHPILVLDFQSLYPSIMIAYNICFSTCLGRVEKFKGTNKFGFTELKVADGLLELLKDYLTVTPNGMIFVKPAVRKSLLAKMLGEILDTRVMVKHAMKGSRGDKSLTSLLNARQLGLKLMANVTYGYTSATYSGRMPCIEVADSIVQTGRETLEKAQELIHSRKDWDAQVVYGDTDSLFVALPGRSKEQAFKIGNDIADAVTALNPKPVKLKFEKVYMGSVLMAKKRYVGFKYEHPDDTEPVFDAKGIETIRRDGFPAQQKIEEVCLKLLFRTQDLSQIKDFCRQEWTKILQNRVSVQDFIVAKEVRLGSYSEKGVPPPGAAVAYRRILKDPRDEPQYGERVPYIISNADGKRLIERARTPEDILANRTLSIDSEYYIRNLLIPPLSRIFNLVGADVENWFDTMPRTKRVGKYERQNEIFRSNTRRGNGKGKGKGRGMRIDSHFKSSHCIVCGVDSSSTICEECQSDPSTTTHALLSRSQLASSKLMDLHKICASCSGIPVGEKIMCDSIDCPITYARINAERDVEDLEDVGELLRDLQLGQNHDDGGGVMEIE
uniref:DNA polymerase zeta catalytic subunit n=1 Tax=Kwoniella dejecticola CBS 10117 TaxID=1296121 RepID=A0A1A6A799_9TREE|nr:DNA polymerase zeta subunit [Kwoniella dejecticola CBS 10117]OBR85928.1 DNA polymerase zeta subunit [Kwoniella dejecticola CBS 10117]